MCAGRMVREMDAVVPSAILRHMIINPIAIFIFGRGRIESRVFVPQHLLPRDENMEQDQGTLMD